MVSPAFIRYALMSVLMFALAIFLLKFRLHLQAFLAYALAINAVGFLLYILDKGLSLKGWLRVPESLLYLVTFLGATPAAIVAQQLFWHKTTKRSFQIIFWSIALVQTAGIYIVVYTDLLQNIF